MLLIVLFSAGLIVGRMLSGRNGEITSGYYGPGVAFAAAWTVAIVEALS
ncbi:MAG: hypothetical protein IRY85_21565 [Micromonosporaceae bacterium]|nr:hypothetical protein [Micromonosporaceae bacterium]